MAEYVKVSISMPGDLVEQVKERAGSGGVSAYVTDAVRHRMQMEGLRDLVERMEAKHGPADETKVQAIIDEYFT
ncbi:ribbon-helix-helix domain-containing protein [Nocardioides sp. AN3]